ncbi:hypothetical protein AP060_04216 [Pseudomonas sp. TAD18]|nr:hypothetical protein AP060_04216 [Pseudomonas sp. TAD18]KVV02858.1 hypothetical protein AP059_04198 [Pseudomonas sp. TAA207]
MGASNENGDNKGASFILNYHAISSGRAGRPT